MSSLMKFLKSSLGRKYLMGLTGLGLAGFVLTHMAGNLLFLVGPKAYNLYGHKLVTNPAIYLAEAGLLGMFLVHIACAWSLSFQNWSARKVAYRQVPNGAKEATLASQTMLATGSLIAAFVVLHLIHFKFGRNIPVTDLETFVWVEGQAAATYSDGHIVRDLYTVMKESFQSLTSPYLWGYFFALVLLLVHLRHGVSSALQSLGLMGPKYRDFVYRVGVAYALVVSLGFMLPPFYCAFFL